MTDEEKLAMQWFEKLSNEELLRELMKLYREDQEARKALGIKWGVDIG